MLAGADSIDDMDLLRHGGTQKVFKDLRAPSTYGTFLRIFTHGHVRQLDAIASRLLTNLQAAASRAGSPLLPDADELVDIDDTIRQTYGYAKRNYSAGLDDLAVGGVSGAVLVWVVQAGVGGVAVEFSVVLALRIGAGCSWLR